MQIVFGKNLHTFILNVVVCEVDVHERHTHEVLGKKCHSCASQLTRTQIQVRQVGSLHEEPNQTPHSVETERVATQVDHLQHASAFHSIRKGSDTAETIRVHYIKKYSLITQFTYSFVNFAASISYLRHEGV